ncbi:MAG: Glycine betaine methyltransferase [Phycisphaerae bacterium]|nr:Glycine betaine methyltransferase [Phycisphaerae bacterium]
MFPPADIARIHDTALNLLADPGVRLEHGEIIRLMLAAGATPGHGANVVRISREMIAERLATAPPRVRLASLDGGVVEIGAGTAPLFWTGAALNWIEPGGRCREIASADLAAWARLIDALGSVHGVVGTAMSDVPPRGRDFVGLRVMAENCRKHLRALSFTAEGAEAMREMARVLAGGAALRDRPVLSMGFTAHGPLRWTNLALDIYLRSAGDRIPVTVNGEPVAGASGPITLAGSAAVGHAEILAGIVVNQVIEPGRPCIHNLGFAHILDMRTASAVTAGPETCLLAGLGAALARHCNLPSLSWIGSDAMVPDEQASAETMMGAIAHAQAGVNVVWGVGSLESEKSISPVKAVMDDEIVGMVRRLLRGAPAGEEELAEQVVREAGIAGEFLGSDHTMARFRSEFYEPRLLCRVRRDAWEQAGGRTLSAVARERTEAILSAERRPLLEAAVSAELARIEKHYLSRL